VDENPINSIFLFSNLNKNNILVFKANENIEKEYG